MLLFHDPNEYNAGRSHYQRGLLLPFTMEVEVYVPPGDNWVTHPVMVAKPKSDPDPSWALNHQRKRGDNRDGSSSSLYAGGYQGYKQSQTVQARFPLEAGVWNRYTAAFSLDEVALYVNRVFRSGRRHTLQPVAMCDRLSWGFHQYGNPNASPPVPNVPGSKRVRFRNFKLWDGFMHLAEAARAPEQLELPQHAPRSRSITVTDWPELKAALASARENPGTEIHVASGSYEAEGQGFGVPDHTSIIGAGHDTVFTKTITANQTDAILINFRMEVPTSELERYALLVDGSYGEGSDVTIRNVESHAVGPRGSYESFEVTHGAPRVLAEECIFHGAGQNVLLTGSTHVALRRCLIKDGTSRMPQVSTGDAMLIECAIDLDQPLNNDPKYNDTLQSYSTIGSKAGETTRAGFVRCAFRGAYSGKVFGDSTGLGRDGGVYVEDMEVNEALVDQLPQDLRPANTLVDRPYLLPDEWDAVALPTAAVWDFVHEVAGPR